MSVTIFPWVWIFSGNSVFFREFVEFWEICKLCRICKIHKLWEIHKFHYCCSGTAGAISHQAVRKNCIVYSLFRVFTVIIVVVIIIVSFVVWLNCLYLSPQVLLFIHSPPHPTGEGGWGEQLHGPSNQLPG